MQNCANAFCAHCREQALKHTSQGEMKTNTDCYLNFVNGCKCQKKDRKATNFALWLGVTWIFTAVFSLAALVVFLKLTLLCGGFWRKRECVLRWEMRVSPVRDWCQGGRSRRYWLWRTCNKHERALGLRHVKLLLHIKESRKGSDGQCAVFAPSSRARNDNIIALQPSRSEGTVCGRCLTMKAKGAKSG